MSDEVSNRWFAVIHVMSRLGLFKPYLKFTEYLLNNLCGIKNHTLEEKRK